jgi:GDPmannose 4,6-dehydratase
VLAEVFIAQEIIRTVVLIALGKQDRLYIYDLSIHLYWDQGQLKFKKDDSSQEITGNNGSDITLREFVSTCFAEVGIEIEFCGRGQVEKGVIIDIDEERLDILNIDKEHIKFGQTVVKIEDKPYVLLNEKFLGENDSSVQSPIYFKSDFNFGILIKNLIIKCLKQVRTW